MKPKFNMPDSLEEGQKPSPLLRKLVTTPSPAPRLLMPDLQPRENAARIEVQPSQAKLLPLPEKKVQVYDDEPEVYTVYKSSDSLLLKILSGVTFGVALLCLGIQLLLFL